MALTQTELNEILTALKAASQDVTALPEATDITGVSSLPAMQGNNMVSVPMTLLSSLLTQQAINSATSATDTANTAKSTADEAKALAQDAPTKALIAAAEAAGAVYNEATGFFELNSLTDITTEQMAKILYSPPVLISGHYQVPVGVRTNIAADEPASFWNGGNDMLNLQDIAVNAGNLEVLKLANESKVLFCSSIAHIARGAVKLRKIMGAIRNGAGSNFFTTNAFAQCAALEEVRVHTLNFNVSFSDSPKLSLASLQYMVTNGANNATPITVTVHPTVYAKLTDTANAEWYAVLTAAAAKKISFATTA